MLSNTKKNLLDTIDPKMPEVICPACGSPITLQNKSTYDVILSVNARKETNNILRIYRSLLQSNESELKTRNLYGFSRETVKGAYPFPTWKNLNENGEYESVGAKKIEKFLSAPDLLGISKKNAEIPPFRDLERLKNDKTRVEEYRKLNETIIKTILFGFTPHSMIGPILSLIFDQEDIKSWVNNAKLGVNSIDKELSSADSIAAKILEIVRKAAPNYYKYLIHILNIIDDFDSQPENSGLPKNFIPNATIIKDRAIRCIYTLAIFLGHDRLEDDSIPFLSKDIPYDLPRQVVISQPILNDLLRAKVLILRKTGFGWTAPFIDLLTKNNSDSVEAEVFDAGENFMDDREKNLAELVNKYSFLGDNLTNFVDFACRGLPGSMPTIVDETAKQSGGNSDSEKANPPENVNSYCGWYPKQEITHPILFIGSTGTTKSSVMLSGLTTFVNAASSMGITIRSTSADDVSMLKAYSDQFFKGRMPKATETNSRYSVQLTAVNAKEPDDRVNFIFTDIPGEMVARSLEKKDTDPVVMNLLKYAEVIVFFFDIATEPCIYNTIYYGQNKEEWSELIKHVQYLREKENRGITNQSLLLGKLIEDLRQIRDSKKIKEEITLICVIPKTDLYVGEGETRFMTSFYTELKKSKIIDTSQLNNDSDSTDFANLRSMAGISFQENNSSERPANDEELIDKQLKIAESISEQAKINLSNIGNALGNAGASDTDRKMLKNAIAVGLFQVIEGTFNKVFVLPVSAQGKPATPEDNEEQKTVDLRNKAVSKNNNTGNKNSVDLKHPPSQKLAEYVFIIPTVLALKKKAESQT